MVSLGPVINLILFNEERKKKKKGAILKRSSEADGNMGGYLSNRHGCPHMNPWALVLSDSPPVPVLPGDDVCPFQCHRSSYN